MRIECYIFGTVSLLKNHGADNIQKHGRKKSLERKHAHPHDVLSQKMVILFWKKRKTSRQMGRVDKWTFERSQKGF